MNISYWYSSNFECVGIVDLISGDTLWFDFTSARWFFADGFRDGQGPAEQVEILYYKERKISYTEFKLRLIDVKIDQDNENSPLRRGYELWMKQKNNV